MQAYGGRLLCFISLLPAVTRRNLHTATKSVLRGSDCLGCRVGLLVVSFRPTLLMLMSRCNSGAGGVSTVLHCARPLGDETSVPHAGGSALSTQQKRQPVLTIGLPALSEVLQHVAISLQMRKILRPPV